LKSETSPARSEKYSHYELIDISRGLAAICVLLWHYQHFFYIAPETIAQSFERTSQPYYAVLSIAYDYGYHAVAFFWVLSGFVFGAAYSDREPRAREFFVNRFARLYPLHLATLIIVAVLQFLSWKLVGDFQIYPQNDAYHFLLNLLFISHWGLQSGWSFNAPIWSISVEIVAYAVFFLTLKPMARYGLMLTSGVMIASACALAFGISGFFLECLLYFFAGNSAFIVLKHSRGYGAVVGLILVVGWVFLRHMPSAFTPIGLVPFFTGIVLLLGVAEHAWRSVGFSRYLRWIGNVSYGTYLLHVPIQITAILVLDAISADRLMLANEPAFLLVFLFVTLVVAFISFIKFERPAQRKLRALLT